ncbi:MAG: bacterioferritin [bacterium]|nr:bacterioferritin [bacterium]
MKGNKEMIGWLNRCLGTDLAAIDIYFIQSRMFEDWGLSRLHERLNHEMEHERLHASKLIERILFLEGQPVLTARKEYEVGTDVPSMLQADLSYELAGVAELREAIAFAESAQDYASRELLESLLQESEEDHVYWLEQQIGLIERMGLANYLQSNAGGAA